MSQSNGKSSARTWWLFVGALVVFVVGFTLLERLVRGDADPATSAEKGGDAASPARPEVRRLEDGAVEIRHDFFRRTTIRLGDEEAGQALFDCLEQGFDEAFAEGTEGWTGARVRRETRRVQDACMGSHGVPTVPRPPGAGRADP